MKLNQGIKVQLDERIIIKLLTNKLTKSHMEGAASKTYISKRQLEKYSAQRQQLKEQKAGKPVP